MQFRTAESVNQHHATQHAIDREALDQPEAWDDEHGSANRVSVLRKYVTVVHDGDGHYIEVPDPHVQF